MKRRALIATPMVRKAAAGSLALVGAVVAVLAACNDPLPTFACEDIPAGGCPTKSIDVCVDGTCAAVYRCNADATWSKVRDCPAQPAAADAGLDANDAAAEASHRGRDAGLDAPPGASGGPGCLALQPPECSLGYALACDPDDCCGCDDVFVCADGGWSAWGTCNGGALTPSGSGPGANGAPQRRIR